jgi:hypothetical protein
MSQICHDSQYCASGHHQITVADTPVSIFVTYLSYIQKASTVAGKTDTSISATSLLLTAMDYDFYYTLDGTVPATDGSAGHWAQVGDSVEIKGWRNIKNFKLVRVGSNSVKVNVTVFFNEPGV